MQRIAPLDDAQVVGWEEKLEAQMVDSLQSVMDAIAARISKSALVAAVTTGPDGDDLPPPMTAELAIPDPPITPATIPETPALPPGQPYISPDDLASITPLWQEQVVANVLPLVAQVFVDSAGNIRSQLLESVAPDVAVSMPRLGSLAAEQYLAQVRDTFDDIGGDLWETARAQMLDGFEQGESIPQIADRLRQSAGLTARQGVLVARTSVIEASNYGSLAMARVTGLQMQKEWIATPDLRTRPTHLEADGQRVDINEPFIVGGHHADFPADPVLPPSERYRCRCTVGYVMPDRPKEIEPTPEPSLAELPGTSGVAIEAAPAPEVFPSLAGPDFDIPARGPVVLPSFVRPSLKAAKTPRELRRVWSDEAGQITGFPFVIDAMPRGISMVTAREYAEGTLQMLERFPGARVDRIHWFDDPASSSYAQVRRGGHAIEFNMKYASEAGRPKFIAARRRDAAGWETGTTSWGVRNDMTGQGVVYHEFVHVLDIENTRESIHGQIIPLLIRHAQREGVTDVDDLIKRSISSYATKNYQEMIAEAGADVMVNGAAASQLSRDIFDLLRAEYRRRGFEVRTAPLAEELGGEVFPKLAKATKGSTIGDVVRGPTQFELAMGEAETTPRIFSTRDLGDHPLVGPEGVVLHRGLRLPSDFKSPLEKIRRGEFILRPGLTEAESEALDLYVLSAVADPLNGAWRAGRAARGIVRAARRDVDLEAVSRDLDSAIAASELAQDTNLYRGVLMRSFDVGKLQVGATTTESGFLSTTTEQGNAFQIIDWRKGKATGGRSPVIFKILAPKGAHAAVAHAEEMELLLGRGRTLRVVDVLKPTQPGDVRVVTVELLPERATLPVVTAPRALPSQTVAQLRALAKERGITVPAGTRKADLVRMIEEAPSVPSAPAAPIALTEEMRTSLTVAEQVRVRALVRRDPQIFATVRDRFGPISSSGNLGPVDAAWLDEISKRERAFVERAVQEASIKRDIAAEAKKLNITPTQYRAREAGRLKGLVSDKPIAVRVSDETGLRDILSSGRFKTSLEGAKRAPGLVVAKDRRQLGEAIMGIPADTPLADRPVYGYVAIRGIEPALSPGRKIAGLAQREGQEDILSVYGQIQVVLKPEMRARTTVTVGDSLDEVGLVRPSPIDAPGAESIGTARRLEAALTEPSWTRSRYVEAQIRGGVRSEDIAEVIFAEQPSVATVDALRQSGIPWRILRKGDEPILPTTTPVVAPPPPLSRAPLAYQARQAELRQAAARLVVSDQPIYGGGSAYTRMVEHEGGPPTITKDTTRIGKGATAKRDADAEELGSLTSEAVGIRAPTVIRIDPSKIEMEFLEGKLGGGEQFSLANPAGLKYLESDDGRLMGLLDYITGNPDRSDSNWLLLPNGRIASIDMGDAFRTPKLAGTRDIFASRLMLDETGKLRKTIDIAPQDLAVIRARLEALRPEFERLGRATWHKQVMARLADVEKRADPAAAIRLAEARPDLATVKAQTRAAARAQAATIATQRGNAALIARIDELVQAKASKAVIRQELDPALREAEQLYAGADKATADALRTAVDSGDAAKIRAALTRQSKASGLTPIGKAGAKAKFDSATMEGVGGTAILDGADVIVVRRGAKLAGIETPEKAVVRLARAPSTEKTVAKGDFAGLTRTSEAMGGNPGGIFEAGDGSRWYVKAAAGAEQARSEALALDLYRAAGLDAPELVIGEGVEGLGTRQVATRFLDDAKVDLRARLADDPAYIAEVQDGFAVDAWLANWDVVGANPAAGRGWDNIVSVADRPVRIEAGGALRFRGLGSEKAFGDLVAEFDTLRDPATAKRAAQIFGDMTPEQIVKSAERVRKVTPTKIKALVKKHGLDPELADTLIARRADILRRAELLAGPKPLTPAQFSTAIKAAAKRQDALDAVPIGRRHIAATEPGEEGVDVWRGLERDQKAQEALNEYVSQGFEDANGALRPNPTEMASRYGRRWVPDIDRALDQSRLTADAELWRAPGSGRGIFGDPATWGDDLAGFEWTDPAYSSTSASKRIADRFTKDGGVRLHILAPKGSKAIQLSESKHPLTIFDESAAEAEILLARGARYRIVKDRRWTEITHPTTKAKIKVRDLDVEVIVPDETPPLPWETK